MATREIPVGYRVPAPLYTAARAKFLKLGLGEGKVFYLPTPEFQAFAKTVQDHWNTGAQAIWQTYAAASDDPATPEDEKQAAFEVYLASAKALQDQVYAELASYPGTGKQYPLLVPRTWDIGGSPAQTVRIHPDIVPVFVQPQWQKA